MGNFDGHALAAQSLATFAYDQIPGSRCQVLEAEAAGEQRTGVRRSVQGGVGRCTGSPVDDGGDDESGRWMPAVHVRHATDDARSRLQHDTNGLGATGSRLELEPIAAQARVDLVRIDVLGNEVGTQGMRARYELDPRLGARPGRCLRSPRGSTSPPARPERRHRRPRRRRPKRPRAPVRTTLPRDRQPVPQRPSRRSRRPRDR